LFLFVEGVELTPVRAGCLMNFSSPQDKHNLIINFLQFIRFND